MALSDIDKSPLYIDSTNGRVGIGTSSPAYNLDVYNSASAGAPLLARFKSAGGDTQLYVDNSTITTQLTADSFSNSGLVGTLTNHPFVFRTNNIERMRIDSGGNVGIGTTSPTFATIDTYSQRGIEISGTKESGTAPVIKLTENGSGKGAFEIRSNREGLTSGNYLAFGENTDTFMVIRGDDDGGGTSTRGNVGIGTSSPSQKLTVEGASGYLFTVQENSANNVRLQAYLDTNQVGLVAGYNTTARDMTFYAGGAERFRIKSGGEISYNNDPASGAGGVNIALSASYNDTSNHLVGTVNTQSFALITINTSNGATHIPVYRNGGAGVAYGGTMLDPDNQTWVALGTSITFNQPGSFPQTFVVSITTGGSQLYVQRTSGSNAYSVFVQLLG